MLTGISNFALVQLIQVIVWLFFIGITCIIVSVRLRLPKTKFEPLLDVIMTAVIFVYALVLRVIFST